MAKRIQIIRMGGYIGGFDTKTHKRLKDISDPKIYTKKGKETFKLLSLRKKNAVSMNEYKKYLR